MSHSSFWLVRGGNLDEAIKNVKKLKKEELVATIVNDRLNDFMGNHADYRESDTDPRGHGKRVPYIGWFWRSTDFYNKRIAIGDCGGFIGVMENNKWDYPERDLTEDEADKVIALVWAAKQAAEAGGLGSEIIANTNAKLDELWDLFQTFEI